MTPPSATSAISCAKSATIAERHPGLCSEAKMPTGHLVRSAHGVPFLRGLATRHPIVLALGFGVMVRDAATRLRLSTLLVYCERGIAYCRRAADVEGEIVRDAGCGETLVDEVARDGKITPAETAQLRRAFEEIRVEAHEGKIL